MLPICFHTLQVVVGYNVIFGYIYISMPYAFKSGICVCVHQNSTFL